MRLSILIPVYNESRYLEALIEKVVRQSILGIAAKEIVIVDDGSTDGSVAIIENLVKKYEGQIVAVFHAQNAGKGAAIRSAVEKMTGDLCIIQDADWEYDPQDYSLVLEPMITGRADCVYGSRFIGTQSKRVLYFWHYVGNKVLTLLSNMCSNLNLTDMETGYKAFRSDILKTIPIRSRDFGFEPEITAKIARRKCRVYEVGISYNGRTYEEGKKIIWIDGLKAVFVILKFWLVNDSKKHQ
ncbi:MAG: glycosyltransferase family 2 protein [Candidatus Omnitrophica bacterium]|nr:glycosyltransferase family 2 protein [Candidatus Omnitrophota bacterium]